MQCAGADGDIAVVVGTEDDAITAIDRTRQRIKTLRVGADLQYRDDLEVLYDNFRHMSNVLIR